MGQSGRWWRQHQSQGSAQTCSANPCHALCFCCSFGRWKRCDMGPSRLWWWQYRSQGSAETFVVPDLMCTASVAFQALSVVRVRAVLQRSEVAWQKKYGGWQEMVFRHLKPSTSVNIAMLTRDCYRQNTDLCRPPSHDFWTVRGHGVAFGYLAKHFLQDM